MPGVTVVHWNPRRIARLGLLGELLPVGPRVGNFGDLLGPIVVAGLLRQRGIDPRTAPAQRRLLSVGSILHKAREGDTVWGSGVNLKVRPREYRFRQLDVRAVRGPRTAAWLRERGIAVPDVYGDPGLLAPVVLPELRDYAADKRHAVTIVPNLHDAAATDTTDDRVLDPRTPVHECLERIARSELVVGSSLHGAVVAESLGIPARLVRAGAEPPLKYVDYYAGTGRSDVEFATSAEEAIEQGGVRPPQWDPQPLLDAFPEDLWR
ncbi:pyruvyltransferase [Jatrophihabitans endophyticus]|uniref:Pyruvyltransferase n=1 Tax=Jatrophihabitans endophyticus TaxID=1206085 RepID=A0A1M5IJV0_9ACTN|nr:polysaccharide pyruvyl transferase family protein [Jatrophihabitans endophyticus]SHG28634.1 pyruvyltransferase [Jatrophihabitans endophyticus]